MINIGTKILNLYTLCKLKNIDPPLTCGYDQIKQHHAFLSIFPLFYVSF